MSTETSERASGDGASPSPPEGQTFAGSSLAARYASFVKLPHTLFALPFAGVGAIFASYGQPEALTLQTVALGLVAFTAARFVAMGFNRIADRRHDALNPRTRARELPAGRLSLAQAWASVGVMAVVFVAAAWALNPLCGMLSPVALFWVCFYSYTKRFTAWAHHALGLALGIAPVGAYLAVTGQWAEPWYALVVLAAAVSLWVAGFDVIYAVQDVDFDRDHGLHSVPARYGLPAGLTLARIFHLLAVGGFLLIWLFELFPVGYGYLAGVGLMAVLLHFEHRLLRGGAGREPDLGLIDRAFFRVNVTVSTTFFGFALLDRLFLG